MEKQLEKLASLGILVLSMRDGVVVLRLDSELFSGEVKSDSPADAIAQMRKLVDGAVGEKVAELEAKIERLRAAL